MARPLSHNLGSLMTLDEWTALPEDNTYRYELQECRSPAATGELVTSAPFTLRIDIPALIARRS